MNKDMLKQIIIDTIKGEEHLGENLKEQCVDYIEQLQNNWNELKKRVKKQREIVLAQEHYMTVNVCDLFLSEMQELEQGKDE